MPEPSTVEPSLNVTVPVGVPTPGALAATEAMSVTACPRTDFATEGTATVAVASGPTVNVVVPEAGASPASPL